MDFTEFSTTKKGDIGEAIFDNIVSMCGYVIRKPKPGSHLIDRLLKKDGKNQFFVDIKTKEKRIIYNDTGIDENDFLKYKKLEIESCLPVYIIFVDMILGEVYGNTLSELEKIREGNYPRTESNGIRYWSMKNMITFAKLTKQEIALLQKYTTVSEQYIQPLFDDEGNQPKIARPLLGKSLVDQAIKYGFGTDTFDFEGFYDNVEF